MSSTFVYLSNLRRWVNMAHITDAGPGLAPGSSTEECLRVGLTLPTRVGILGSEQMYLLGADRSVMETALRQHTMLLK